MCAKKQCIQIVHVSCVLLICSQIQKQALQSSCVQRVHPINELPFTCPGVPPWMDPRLITAPSPHATPATITSVARAEIESPKNKPRKPCQKRSDQRRSICTCIQSWRMIAELLSIIPADEQQCNQRSTGIAWGSQHQ